MDTRQRWLALYVLCLGSLMIVLDATIVNVALPSIREDLGFSETSLAWVVNAYLLTYGGLLLLGGRLGDLYGHRRLFIYGITLFTLSSLACGLSGSQGFLVGARAVQGIGGAVASAVSLSLIMILFTEVSERAKAMGFFGFVASGGGTLGVLLGGVLTDALSWHWIFLVNVPIGAAVCVLCLRLLPPGEAAGQRAHRRARRAVAVTGALMVAVYAIVNGNENGWTSFETLGLLALAVALLALFGAIESRVGEPLVPLRLFRLRNVATANTVGVLWAAAMFAWFFLAALYLQIVLGYSPLEVGLGFAPSTIIMGAFSLGLSARLVMRYGYRPPLAVGLTLAACGLLLFARAPVDGTYVVDVLPSMVLLGFGAGMAFNPVLHGRDERRRAERGRPRVRRRQHLVHDGRRARPRGARERGGIAYGQPARLGRERAAGDHLRLPHGVPDRRPLRAHGRGAGQRAAARDAAGSGPRGAPAGRG